MEGSRISFPSQATIEGESIRVAGMKVKQEMSPFIHNGVSVFLVRAYGGCTAVIQKPYATPAEHLGLSPGARTGLGEEIQGKEIWSLAVRVGKLKHGGAAIRSSAHSRQERTLSKGATSTIRITYADRILLDFDPRKIQKVAEPPKAPTLTAEIVLDEPEQP